MVAEILILCLMAGLMAIFWGLRLQTIPCDMVPAKTTDPASISVLIPARNEAERLPELLASLRAQNPPPLEVIVIDDASTDATSTVAQQCGARVLPAGPLPAGWRGKTWACHRGAESAIGDIFLFLDADTRLENAQSLARLRASFPHGGVLSVLPLHRMRRPDEQFSAIFNLLTAAGVGALNPAGREGAPSGLFGQSMMIDRNRYRECGGHAVVRGETLENLTLAGHLRSRGVPMRLRDGRGTLWMRMYPGGLAELTRGWAKAFAQGAAKTAPARLWIIASWISMAWILFGGLTWTVLRAPGSMLTAAWLALYLVFALHLGRLLRQLGNYSRVTALFFPVILGFYLAVFTASARIAAGKGAAYWKGRRLEVPPPDTKP